MLCRHAKLRHELIMNQHFNYLHIVFHKEESYHLIGVGKTCPQLYNQNSLGNDGRVLRQWTGQGNIELP